MPWEGRQQPVGFHYTNLPEGALWLCPLGRRDDCSSVERTALKEEGRTVSWVGWGRLSFQSFSLGSITASDSAAVSHSNSSPSVFRTPPSHPASVLSVFPSHLFHVCLLRVHCYWPSWAISCVPLVLDATSMLMTPNLHLRLRPFGPPS